MDHDAGGGSAEGDGDHGAPASGTGECDGSEEGTDAAEDREEAMKEEGGIDGEEVEPEGIEEVVVVDSKSEKDFEGGFELADHLEAPDFIEPEFALGGEESEDGGDEEKQTEEEPVPLWNRRESLLGMGGGHEIGRLSEVKRWSSSGYLRGGAGGMAVRKGAGGIRSGRESGVNFTERMSP